MTDADVIVIGSGAGGMTSALSLAQGGKRVLLFEQHYVPGGWCHSFYLDGQRFSPGVHYIGELGIGQSSRRILEGLGIANDLSFFQMNVKGYDHCIIGDRRIDLPAHPDRLMESMRAEFPHERVHIKHYLRLLKHVFEELGMAIQIETFWDYLTVPLVTRHLGRTGLFSLQHVLNRHIKDPVLKTAMSMQCGNYGLSPKKARFLLHAAVAGHYFNGGFYPAGGGGAFTKAFTNGIRRAGSEVHTQARVDRILIENGNAIGVRMADGREYRSDYVVSNADPHRTYFGMVGPEYINRKYRKKLSRMSYSHAAVNTFIIVDADLRQFGMDSGNIWYSAYDDLNKVYDELIHKDPFVGDEFPAIFLGSPTLKDPSSFDGRYHTIEAITFLPYEHFKQFAGSRTEERSDAYLASKEKLQKKILKTIERFLPGLSRHIVRCEVGTPLTASYYIESTHGNSYGTAKTLSQLGPFGFNMFSPIKGLYHAGASTISHGVIGACNSGLMVAGKILDASPQELLSHDTDQFLRVYPAEDPGSWPAWLVEKQKTRIRRTQQREQEHSQTQ
jgi:phytoene dehydrogenase-like protein